MNVSESVMPSERGIAARSKQLPESVSLYCAGIVERGLPALDVRP
jgi:hypothetical protein